MQKNSNICIRTALAIRESEKGFSILELLVAMVIFMVVTGSIYGVLQVAQKSRGAVNNKVQVTKSVRLGLNLVGRDTYSAGIGYPLDDGAVILRDNRIATRLGIPADTDTTRDTVPPIIAGNNITLNTFNETPNVYTDQVTFFYKDSTFNPTPVGSDVSKPLNIISATTTGSEVTVSSNAQCLVNDLYLVLGDNAGFTLVVATSLGGTDRVRFASGDVLGFNNPVTGGEMDLINPKSMHRVKMVTYFVTADGTLTRREFVNVPPAVPAVPHVDEPLVYGVENFQIQYVMDDGTLSDNPSAGPDGIAGNGDDDQFNLAAVRQIRYTISVRTTEPGPTGQPLRVDMTSTFSTRNLGYDAN